MSILSLNRYSIPVGGLRKSNSGCDHRTQSGSPTWKKSWPLRLKIGRLYVSSSLCNEKLRQGSSFSDVGHNAVSFDAAGLGYVNNDASTTGDIVVIRVIGGK